MPSGDSGRGFGAGGAGVQINLPVSAALGERFVGHFNLGGTWIPSARTAAGRGPSTGLNVGQGLIWLAHQNVNLMLETAYAITEVDTAAGVERSDSLVVSPGVRGALNLPFGLQVVGGLAFPFGFGPSSGTRAAIAYLSFEHAVTKNPW